MGDDGVMVTDLDEDTLHRACSYFGRDPRVPREIVDEVLYEFGGETWSLDEFLVMINAAVAQIPPERRHTAKVELNGGYEESTSLKISFARTETPAEVATNVGRAIAYAREQQAGERATYEALKRKFEA